MDIVERLRSYVGNHVYESHDTLESVLTEAADEILRLREWIRHIGYYVSRNEIDPTSTEKYLQKVCASALKEGE